MIDYPDWRQTIRAAANELDLRQLEILSRLTETRRLEIMFDMCESARALALADEQMRHPELGEVELVQRVRKRLELKRELDRFLSRPIRL
jgi:hypothetical protein